MIPSLLLTIVTEAPAEFLPTATQREPFQAIPFTYESSELVLEIHVIPSELVAILSIAATSYPPATQSEPFQAIAFISLKETVAAFQLIAS